MLRVRGCQTLIDQALQTEGLIIPTSYKASEVFGRLRQVIVYKRRARLRWQSQPRELGGNPNYADIEQIAKRQASAGTETNLFEEVVLNHSVGTKYSLLRIMFSRERAASSIVLGSVFNLCTSSLSA